MLTGFKINAGIAGVDRSIDPSGENQTHATIAYCVLQSNGTCGGTVIEECDGTISNCLIADNSTICFCLFPVVRRCHGLIRNCTIANNDSGVAVGDGSSTTLQNCIIYHNFDHYWAQISVGSGGTLNISYCDVQHGSEEIYLEDPNCVVNWGPGNIDAEPCFARVGYWDEELEQLIQGDYYLQSVAGRWDPNQNDWVIDANTSPCIDAGNPGCPLGDEPNDPNNVRINMGAYGGTAEASKSPANWAILADLTNDHIVDFNDLEVFVYYWLESGQCIPSDLNRSQSVDSIDFGIFSLQWLDTSIAEASITYQIDDCDSEALPSFAAEQSGQTRFTVTVEGRYIHFEDMMVANCCPEELGLEMTVEDNLIIIYETEYTPGGCWCICDYPVTATLGPFEPGTYTLEVYQDEYYGGFIGSTTVTIGSGQ